MGIVIMVVVITVVLADEEAVTFVVSGVVRTSSEECFVVACWSSCVFGECDGREEKRRRLLHSLYMSDSESTSRT